MTSHDFTSMIYFVQFFVPSYDRWVIESDMRSALKWHRRFLQVLQWKAPGKRWALMHELRGEAEPGMEAQLRRLSPVDLVLIEGYKRDTHPKIEAFRAEPGNPLIAPGDPSIRAIASDTPLDVDRPVFDLDDTVGIADFILAQVGL